MLKECKDPETNMVVGQIQSMAMGLLRASGTARGFRAMLAEGASEVELALV